MREIAAASNWASGTTVVIMQREDAPALAILDWMMPGLDGVWRSAAGLAGERTRGPSTSEDEDMRVRIADDDRVLTRLATAAPKSRGWQVEVAHDAM